ncbi:MAG: extracellular solute-binding protein family 3 [Firmicutes bacterium]|nr:extracellular solute-binding protein family 3 [Bacillota bacterium]
MKKLSALLMALLMVVGLTACGTTPPPAEEGDGSADRPVLRVAMECAYAPYNWSQPTDENGAVPIAGSSDYAYGYDVMMAKIIAEELGYDLEIVKLGWTGIIPAIQAGTVDVGICGQSITAERLESVDFTVPYYYASIVTLVKADGPYANATSVAELDGASATSQLNTVWYDVCLPQIPNVNVLPGQESAPAMIAALSSGRVDVVVTDKPTALSAAYVDPTLKVLEFEGDNAFEVSDEEINIGISMKKGNTELLDAINGVLATMTEDDYNRMMDEAKTLQPLSE